MNCIVVFFFSYSFKRGFSSFPRTTTFHPFSYNGTIISIDNSGIIYDILYDLIRVLSCVAFFWFNHTWCRAIIMMFFFSIEVQFKHMARRSYPGKDRLHHPLHLPTIHHHFSWAHTKRNSLGSLAHRLCGLQWKYITDKI